MNSSAEDSSVSTGDGNSMGDGAAATNPAPNDAPASKSTSKSARVQKTKTDRQAGTDASAATATDTEVSQAVLTETVATHWDRETSEGPTQGSGASSGIPRTESNVGRFPGQGLVSSQVIVDTVGGGVVSQGPTVTGWPRNPAPSSAQAACSASWTSTDNSAMYVNSAASSANNGNTAERTAVSDVFAGYPAMTHAPVTRAPVSHRSDAVVQPLSTPFPRVTLSSNMQDERVLQSSNSLQTSYQHPLSESEKVRSSGSHRRSLSANGYDSLPRIVDQHANVPYVDPPVYRPLDHSIILPTFDGYGDLSLFIQRFESIAAHCGWPPEELLFRMKQRITGDAEYVLGDAIHISSISEFLNFLKVRFGCEAHSERYRAELARLRRGTLTLEQLHLRVHSLVSRAMPGPWSKANDIYARDAFLTALDDDDLRRRIMMACPPPETLSAVFDLAVRASAIDETFKPRTRRDNYWEE